MSPYIGRFAPSPTGLLHLGSLFTALASFLEARSRQGRWLIRIDDLDTPRNVCGANEAILSTLDVFGLHWDGSVTYQSQHQQAYQQALQQLQDQHLLYRCTCSRKNLSDLDQSNPVSESIYPNICRDKNHPQTGEYALRLRTEPYLITFNDGVQGVVSENLASQHGDFILQRKDRIIAYQLAVVVDDYLQGVNHTVRGADLLDATIKQIYLHQCLNLAMPHYLHVPVITGAQGAKLSKREFAPAVNQQNSHLILFKLLVLLQQNPPSDLKHTSVAMQLDWAIQHWNPNALNLVRSIDITNP
ncbi:MAG: tRNA glutamyl-Q(34) synthetase GluQRS [Methylococcaceae bacterium]|nr:tRNA glutamyl-Q(34) synthetase GluQRS [Methylococcaceae bacterium]